MVIGSLFFRRCPASSLLTALAFTLLVLRSTADDQITKTDGSTLSGSILGVSDGQVMIESRAANGGSAKFPITIMDIKSINMAVPADVTQVQGQNVAPGTVIAALEPVVKRFAGLPAGWVVNAMAQLGDAYATTGRVDRALAIYNQISKLYAGTSYENVAKAGKAKISLKAGQIGEALAAVQPIVDQANKNIAPSPLDGALYANAFLVYGEVLEAQKKPQQALEAYLTVKTMFYQDPVLVDEADKDAQKLRDQNPRLGIE